MEAFDPEKENPCWGCEYRKTNARDWENVCLLDDELKCVREEE